MFDIVEDGYLANRIDRVYGQARKRQATRAVADIRALATVVLELVERQIGTPVGARHA